MHRRINRHSNGEEWRPFATDRQIDQLVYELYGLTADEIRILEDATSL